MLNCGQALGYKDIPGFFVAFHHHANTTYATLLCHERKWHSGFPLSSEATLVVSYGCYLLLSMQRQEWSVRSWQREP
jgi:hypothetical protein